MESFFTWCAAETDVIMSASSRTNYAQFVDGVIARLASDQRGTLGATSFSMRALMLIASLAEEFADPIPSRPRKELELEKR